MDAITTSIIRLREQSVSVKMIAVRVGCSEQTVRRVLITAGLFSTPRTNQVGKMRLSGLSTVEIARELGITPNAVISHSPYSKGRYGAEYPTINATRIRKSRKKLTEKKECGNIQI